MLTLCVIFNLIPKLVIFELGIIKALFKTSLFLGLFVIFVILLILI